MTQSTFAVSLQSVNHFDRGNGVAAALEQEFGRGHGSQRHSLQHHSSQRHKLRRHKLQHHSLQHNQLQRHSSQSYGLRGTCAPSDGRISMLSALADNGLAGNGRLSGMMPGSMMFVGQVSGSMVSGGMALFNKALPLLQAGGLADVQPGRAVAFRQTSGRYSNGITVLTEH